MAKLELWAARNVLRKSLTPFNYERVGGLPFLGVDGVSIVGHGGSSALAISNMIRSAVSCINSDINGKIVATFKRINNSDGSKRAKISSVGHYLPEYRLTNFELEKMVDTNDEWIRTRTGISERRILKDPTKASAFMGAESF